MTTPLHWGILGAGIIADRFARAVQQDESGELIAVASKTPAKAREFAERHAIRAAEDYDDLVGDETIDVVYVATTHNFHHANARLALEHDKHVLVEKPFTVSAKEAADLAELARSRNRFAMEAMWTRFLPAWQELRKRVAEGAVGELRHVDVTFGGIVPPHYENRLRSPELAGGVTLDMGVYPVSFVCFLLGERPHQVESLARFSDSGVDEIACYLFRFPGGCLSTISTSFDLLMPEQATLHGTLGYVRYPAFSRGESFSIHRHAGTGNVTDVEEVRLDHEDNGFVYQVREVARRIRAGETESDVMPLAESVEILAVMDRMRESWGFRYPFEAPESGRQ